MIGIAARLTSSPAVPQLGIEPPDQHTSRGQFDRAIEAERDQARRQSLSKVPASLITGLPSEYPTSATPSGQR
jgi:hypothetical protein